MLFSSQREQRLDLHKSQDTERRTSRVSSLRRKPSDPKTTSTSINRQASSRQSADRWYRSTTVERKPSLTRSDGSSSSSTRPSKPKPPPHLSLSFDETSEEVQKPRYRPQKNLSGQSELRSVGTSPGSSTLTPRQTSPSAPTTEEESEEAPEEVQRPRHSRSNPTMEPRNHPNGHPEYAGSSGSSSPSPPPSPQPSPQGSNTSEEVRRPKSKPPLPPKPRVPTEQMFRHGPAKPSSQPDSRWTITPEPAGASSPPRSPQSHPPGPKRAAEEDPPAREEEPASADLPPPVRRSVEVRPRRGRAAVTSARLNDWFLSFPCQAGAMQPNRFEGSLEIKLKHGGNKVTAKETPSFFVFSVSSGTGVVGPPGQQGATRFRA